MATISPRGARTRTGHALGNDEGEAFWLLGMLQTVKIGRADTDGSYGLLEIVVPRARLAVARPPQRGRMVLRPRRQPHVLGRRHASGYHGGGVRVRAQGRAAHILRAGPGPPARWSASPRCSSRDSCARSVSPPRARAAAAARRPIRTSLRLAPHRDSGERIRDPGPPGPPARSLTGSYPGVRCLKAATPAPRPRAHRCRSRRCPRPTPPPPSASAGS